MTFGYVISLRLDGRRAVVVGGGPIAAARVRDLRDAAAAVTVLTPSPSPSLAEAVGPGVTVIERAYRPGDLVDAAVAIATREDELDVDAFWAETRERGVLASVLDDLDHADFAAPALVRRGDLRISVATAGRAPALAKRLRRLLAARLGDEYADLVDVLADARAAAGPRTVPYDVWAARWEEALDDVDGLAALVRAGRRDDVRDHVVATVTGRTGLDDRVPA